MEIIRDRWNGYQYTFGEGERCVVSFDITACDPTAQRPSQLRRVIGFSPEGHISPSGMPSPEAFARLKAIEQALLAQLRARKIDAWLVGRQVYRGYRELLFQVDDTVGFDTAYAAVEDEFGGMKLVAHPDWQFFNDKIRPDERALNHIANRDLLHELEKAGADLAAEHVLDHTFVGGDLAGLETELANHGYTRRSRTDTLTMAKAETLDEQDLIDATTMWLRKIAEVFDASYDGWGTMVNRRAQ